MLLLYLFYPFVLNLPFFSHLALCRSCVCTCTYSYAHFYACFYARFCFYSRSHTVLSSCCISALISCLRSPAILLSCHTFVFCCKIPALLLLLPSMLNPPLLFRSSPLKTFKRFLSNEPWPHVSTSFAKHLCLFLALGAYNPDNNNSLHNSTYNNKRK